MVTTHAVITITSSSSSSSRALTRPVTSLHTLYTTDCPNAVARAQCTAYLAPKNRNHPLNGRLACDGKQRTTGRRCLSLDKLYVQLFDTDLLTFNLLTLMWAATTLSVRSRQHYGACTVKVNSTYVDLCPTMRLLFSTYGLKHLYCSALILMQPSNNRP